MLCNATVHRLHDARWRAQPSARRAPTYAIMKIDEPIPRCSFRSLGKLPRLSNEGRWERACERPCTSPNCCSYAVSLTDAVLLKGGLP